MSTDLLERPDTRGPANRKRETDALLYLDDLRVQQSVEYGFQRGTVAWRGTMRYAVNIHLDGRGATNGPILGLKNS